MRVSVRLIYDYFFNITKCVYDQGAKRRGYDNFYDFAVEISKKLNRSNISAKKHSTNNNVEALYDSAKELLEDALKEESHFPFLKFFKSLCFMSEFAFQLFLQISLNASQMVSQNRTFHSD